MKILKLTKILLAIEIIYFLLIPVYGIFFHKSSETNDQEFDTNSPLSMPSSSNEQLEAEDNNLTDPIVDSTVRILTFGDTGLLEPLGSRVVQDSSYDPLINVEAFFKNFDYVVGTLEATIDGASVGSPNPGKAYTFSTPIESANVFKKAGISAFSYAGNHAKDFGPNGVIHTIEVLNSVGIGTFGAGKNNEAAYTPLIVELKDTKVAFLGFNCMEYDFNHATDSEAGTASFSEWKVRDSIKNAKENADVLVVFAHWGEEHTQELDPVWQIQWANIFTDAGADIVIGGHPHVVQKQDIVNGKPVFYSIGNFMYPGQGGYAGSLEGAAIEIDIQDKKISDSKLHKTTMTNEGIPSIAE